MERHLLEFLPVERKFLVLGGKGVVPILETTGGLFLEMLGELLETLKLDESLDRVPCRLRKPVFDGCWAGDISCQRTVDKEVHLRLDELTLKLSLLHESEGQEGKEDLFMAFKKTTGNPLVDNHTDRTYKCSYALLLVF